MIIGHAFEARIYAENVPKGFLPATGVLHHYCHVPVSSTGQSCQQPHQSYMVKNKIKFNQRFCCERLISFMFLFLFFPICLYLYLTMPLLDGTSSFPYFFAYTH